MSFYKLNFDGCVVGTNPGSSGIGGFIKDSEAACILLFSGPLGVCSVNEAGLVALRTGLRECVNLGLSNIIVEGDSWCASRWVAGSSIPCGVFCVCGEGGFRDCFDAECLFCPCPAKCK